MRKNLFLAILALVALAGYGQAPVFQWGAVVKANVTGAEATNPTNAAKSIKTNANGDVFISGTFTSNNTAAKGFTHIVCDHYDAAGVLTATESPEGAKVTLSASSNNENLFLYKMDKQGQILWQVVSDRGYVDLHYSQIFPTGDGGVFAVINTRMCTGDEFEDLRLLRLVGSDGQKKDVKLPDDYVSNTLQGVAAKIAADGKIEWVKHIIRVDDALIDGKNATTASYFNALVQDDDGNFWLGGRYVKAFTFDKPGGGAETLTPHNVAGWDGDSQKSRGDALLVKLNPQGELLWSLETSGTVDYQSINSLQYHDGALYIYGNIAAPSGSTTASSTFFGHTLSPTDKTNAWSACLDVSGEQPAVRWATLLKSLPQTNGKGGRIKVTNACYDNGALFLAGALTGIIEVNGDTVLANDATTGESANPLMGFFIHQDVETGEILGAHLDSSAGLAAEIENVAFRQDKIYAFGYSLGTTWLHVYNTDYERIDAYSLLAANGATAWDAIFFDDQLITINRGRQMSILGGSITGAPQAFINDSPQAYSAYFVAYQLDLQRETGINLPASTAFDAVKLSSLTAALRIAGNAAVKVFNLTGQQVYSGQVNGEKTIALPAGVYIVAANGKTTKTIVR
jgi:hypothetical protein